MTSTRPEPVVFDPKHYPLSTRLRWRLGRKSMRVTVPAELAAQLERQGLAKRPDEAA